MPHAPKGTAHRTAQRFPLGLLVATPAILETVPRHAMIAALKRHATGDWGLCSDGDSGLNDWSRENGERVLSVYEHDGTRFYIITEPDRSVTTFLLPADY